MSDAGLSYVHGASAIPLIGETIGTNFDRAVEKSLALARSKDADYLPGWCGPAPEE